MINKKKTLGKNPDVVEQKDAVHVAIVSCIAGESMKPGTDFFIGEDKLVYNASNVGVDSVGKVDIWLQSGVVTAGETFWGLIHPDEVSSVSHTWEHKQDFTAPEKVEIKKKYIY